LPIDFACTIGQWTLVTDVAGSCIVEIFKSNLAIPGSAAANNCVGANATNGIALSGSQYGTGGASGWHINACTAGDIIGFYVLSNATCGRIGVGLKVT
jgi:hypothetical protein